MIYLVKKVLVCAAWPYANGPLHLGHVAGSLLAPDIFSRYNKLAGAEVLMVSGSDQHGTPITVHADELGISPEEVAEYYHKINKESIEKLGIEFSLFNKTHDPRHIEVVQDVFKTHLKKGTIFKRSMYNPYCPKCKKFLPDRYVEGTCPFCGYEEARGDQCDNCGRTLDPSELENPRCKICGSTPETRETEHFFLKLSAFQDFLESYLEKNAPHWRKNAISHTNKWLAEGLRDRAITRDLLWGVEIPLKGYDDKRIYVWFEAVIGYLSCSKIYSQQIGKPDYWKEFWYDPEVKSYYFLGKDNIPFHTIIWPAILHGYDENLNLPYDVPANEYLMLSGAQFSKSRKHAVWLNTYLENYDPDVLRFYLTWIMPEIRDTDFRWDQFVEANNNVLVATFGNLINRILTFTYKNFGSVPEGDAKVDTEIETFISDKGQKIADFIEGREFKGAIRELFDLAKEGNKWFGRMAPWALVKEDRKACGAVLHAGLRLARALALYSYPFMPFTAKKLWKLLGEEDDIVSTGWNGASKDIESGRALPEPEILFHKLDLKEVLAREEAAAQNPVLDELKEELKSHGVNVDKGEDKMEEIDIDYLSKIDLVVGTIKEAKDHPNADRLFVLKVDIGTEVRQIVAGLKKWYDKDALIGKKIILVKNLKPAKLRGMESQGMLLAAEDEDKGLVKLLTVDGEVSSGSKIH